MHARSRSARASRPGAAGGRPWLAVLTLIVAASLAACGAGPAASTGLDGASGGPSAGTTATPGTPGATGPRVELPADAADGDPGSLPGELPAPEPGDLPGPETTAVLAGTLGIGQATSPTTGTLGAGGGALEAGGLTLDAPAGAFASDVAVSVAQAPVTLADTAAYGGAVRPVTPLYTIDTGANEPDLPVTVTLVMEAPAAVPAGSVAMAFYYDPDSGLLSPLAPIGSDGERITALATHFSMILGAVIDLAKVPATVDSGFRPGKDDWQFPNYGSYLADGGHCNGQSVSAIWYYNTQRRAAGASALYGLYDNNGAPDKTQAFWQDDSNGYRLASVVQKDPYADPFTYQFLRTLGREGTDAALTAQAFRLAIAFSGAPQLISIADATMDSAHAMIAYRVTPDRIFVADPNYPARLRTIRVDPVTGAMGPYSSGASATSIAQKGSVAYTRFAYVPALARISNAAMATHWGAFEAGTIGAGAFPDYTLYVLTGTDDAGKESWTELTDGYAAPTETITIGLSRLSDNANVTMGIFAGTSTTPLGAWNWRQEITLAPGDNPLGFSVYGRKGDGWEYVDFKRLTIGFGGASPSPTQAGQTGDDSAPVITAFTGPTSFAYAKGATFPFNVTITGGTAPYHLTWRARGQPLPDTESADGNATVLLTADQIASASNGGGYYISLYVTDSANRGARWMDTANNRPSSEFIYAIEGLEGMSQQAVLYPPVPYPPMP